MNPDKNVCALIIAGGKGTRFWPLSRRKNPKQFLPVLSQDTMIEETVNRLHPWIPSDRIYTIANRIQTETIRRLLPAIPHNNLIVEPEGRNTAPSLILATALIDLNNPETVIAVLPADHVIRDKDRFLNKLHSSAEAAAQGSHLITFGIPPTYPATGYGYIRISRDSPLPFRGENFFNVLQFKEKPVYEEACSFLASGDYYWNSGMFLWRASVFADKLKQFSPEWHSFWEKTRKALQSHNKDSLSLLFNKMPAVSIDYALMEKAQGVLVSRGDFGWSDVGSWSALLEIWNKKEHGIACRGECLSLDSESCLVYSPDKLTALIGVKDIIVVDTKDALLVCHKDHDQKVKDAVEKLKKMNRTDLL